jgi:hypothetical protein
LEKKKLYPIMTEENVQIKYEISALLTIKASSEDAVYVFLPTPFPLVFSDVDMDMSSNAIIKINLVYHGT